MGGGTLRPHRRGTLVDVHLTADAGDDVVWAGVSTYLAKGSAASPGRQRRAGHTPTSSGPAPPASTDSTRGHHVWTLAADTGVRYAEVSGDRNPIHTSKLGAKALGFPRPIAHGMYTAARALASGAGGATARWTGRSSSGSP